MRIAIFTDTFLPTVDGVVTSLLTSVPRLAEKGHDVVLFAPSYGGAEEPELPRTRIVRLPSLPLWTYKAYRLVVPSPLRAIWELRKERPDVIHFHGYAAMAFIAVVTGLVLRVPVVGTYHTLFPEFMTYLSPQRLLGLKKNEQLQAPRLFKWLGWVWSNLLFNRPAVVTTPSGAMRDALLEHGLDNEVVPMSNGIKLERFPFAVREPGAELRLLHLGRISFEKGVDVVLHAMKRLVEQGLPVRLSIAGDGPADDMVKALVTELGLDDKVEILGRIPWTDVHAVYQRHDLFVTASPIETEGLVLLEAMASGLPVVGVDVLAVPEIVRDGKTGFIVDEGDDAAMAERIERLLEDRALLVEMSKAGRRVAERYAHARINDALVDLYEDVIAAYRDGRRYSRPEGELDSLLVPGALPAASLPPREAA